MEDKIKGYTAKEWMLALLEILDGNASPWDIHSQTGLPLERCNEINKMFNDAVKDGWPE